MLFNVYFLFRKSWTFWVLTKNCPKLDKNKSIVSRFSVFVVYRSAVSTVQKSNNVGCFNFRQWRLVFASLFLDISIKLTKLHFQSWKKIPPTISLFLFEMKPEVLRNNCAKRDKDWRLPFFRHLKVSWVKAYQMSCLLIFTPIHPLTRLISLAVEMYRMKGLLKFLETRTLLIQQKITEKVSLYTNNT